MNKFISMTVKELIDKLKEFPQDWDITVLGSSTYEIVKVEEETDIIVDRSGNVTGTEGTGSLAIYVEYRL